MSQRHRHTYYKYKGQHDLPNFGRCLFGNLHLQVADSHCRHALYRHRPVQGDDAQRQHERSHSRQQQHYAVHPMERFLREHQAVEHVEHDDEYRYLGVVYQKVLHNDE